MTHATPTELRDRAFALQSEAKWAVGMDRDDLLAEAALLRTLAAEATEHGVAANDNAPAMPAMRGKDVARAS